ncbi:MAG TPA: TonB-dependent receptor [Hyphomonadaceae bacterium]|nr:TonB-dependent receptor [Hyphomonadaceae bacterium]HPN05512.1 TonB-dependent receptor [Hyphomonadaceae bacterium]
MKTKHLYSGIAVAVLSAAMMGGGAAWAQAGPFPMPEIEDQPTPPERDDIIIVTGTRTTGMTAADSPAPVVVLDSTALESIGQPDLRVALSQNVPSFTAQAFGGDTAALTLSARLRGLSPNHALILLNGKRRHGTSNLAVLGGGFQGNASADLSFIPSGSIERVEVLLDGAAAQYGSDAIAGVINIIQKSADTGGAVSVDGGQYFDGGGETYHVSANAGWAPFEGAYMNLTYDSKFRDDSFRGDFDPRVVNGPWNAGAVNSPARTYPQVTTAADWPYLNRIAGDPQIKVDVFSFNGGYEISDTLEFYTFGSYGFKRGNAHENYRLPNVVTGKAVDLAGNRTDVPFPLGFDPRQGSVEQDYALAAGFTGNFEGFNWDLSTVYGEDKVKITVLNTANADYYRDTSVLATPTTAYKPGYTPRDIYAGAFNSTQWTTTLDGTYDIDVGFSSPVTLAAGAEYRVDGYKLSDGNPISYYKGGSQSYYGFAPTDASDNERESWAVYFDVAANPIPQLTLDAAIRFEDYSDFGDTTIGKLTARYDFSDTFALRGTASTGFRAPTLAEGYYSGINVGPSAINGQLAPNSVGARLLGSNGLSPEESKNLSVGFVAHPLSNLSVTLDVYQIEIENRILGSGGLTGATSATGANVTRLPQVVAAIQANGVQIDPSIYTNASWSIGASFFTNGIDTRTQGADLVINYDTDFGAWGSVDWTLSGNMAKHKVTKVAPPPAALLVGATGPDPALFSRATVFNFEKSSPEYRFMLGAVWKIGDYTISIKETMNGPATSYALSPRTSQPYLTKLDVTYTTDLEVAYQLNDNWKIAVGADNVFNEYPVETPDWVRAEQLGLNSNAYVTKYSTLSPFGINGGYYYGRVSYAF